MRAMGWGRLFRKTCFARQRRMKCTSAGMTKIRFGSSRRHEMEKRQESCYCVAMTKQGLEILLERVSTWPEEAQEEFVRSMANIENKHLGAYRLNDEERIAVRRGLQE